MGDRDTAQALIQALVDFALAEPMPSGTYSYSVPDWPENDIRWKVLEAQPMWWQMGVPDALAQQANERLRALRAQSLRELLEGGMTKPQLASALNVRLRDLDIMLLESDSADEGTAGGFLVPTAFDCAE